MSSDRSSVQFLLIFLDSLAPMDAPTAMITEPLDMDVVKEEV